jgi:hypothetical protein
MNGKGAELPPSVWPDFERACFYTGGMKKYLPTLMLAAGLVIDAQAQSFGDFLKSAAGEVAKNLVTNTATKAMTPNTEAAKAPAAADADPAAALLAAAAAPTAAAAPALPAGCKRIKGANLSVGPRPDDFEPAILWPENTQCPVGRFGDFEFKQAQAAKSAFREASAYPCNDCEGGKYFDAWGGRSLVKNGGDYSKEFPKMLIALEKGKSLGWKGTKYSVSITAIGEQPVGETPCKQFHYTLKQGAKTVSEYDGMFCKWQGAYSSEATWHETV